MFQARRDLNKSSGMESGISDQLHPEQQVCEDNVRVEKNLESGKPSFCISLEGNGEIQFWKQITKPDRTNQCTNFYWI